jgi:hypothetical protein
MHYYKSQLVSRVSNLFASTPGGLQTGKTCALSLNVFFLYLSVSNTAVLVKTGA